MLVDEISGDAHSKNTTDYNNNNINNIILRYFTEFITNILNFNIKLSPHISQFQNA